MDQDMHPTPPIIVGITGKRDLLGKDGMVQQSILAALQLLDEALPASRKVLLSALAAGADTIAAQEALARPGWSVIAVLPFDVETYLQDFDAAGAKQLSALLDRPGVTRRTLTALIDPDTGLPFSEAALARVPGKSTTDRSDHYEQAGLFIAERSALLIGIMDAAETPDRVGGTARIVDFRLRGVRDQVCRRVIERSRELRPYSVLDCPPTGPMWLLDLATVGADHNPLRAVELWRPVRKRVTTRHRAVDLVLRVLGLAGEAGGEDIVVEKTRWRREDELIHGVRMLEWLETFNASIGRKHWQTRIAARKMAGHDAPAVLRWRRAALSMIQSRKKKLWQWAVRGLGGLFLAAILLLELHLEFSVHVGWYLGFLGAILALYVWAAVLQLQQFVEDYRAVSEALRVQLVWWDAGLIGRDYCVDSYYLVGTTGSLATVRAAARLLIMAAELECPPPEPVQGAADTWIRDQIKFFDGNIYKRQTKVLWSEDLTWFCFIGSAGMATMLFDKAAQPFAAIGDWLASHWGVYLIATLGLLIAARIRSLGDEQEGGALLARTLVVLAGLIAFGWGVLSGALFSALGEAQHDRALFADVHGDVGHQLVAVAAVVIASFAGALRFFAERLGWEPELHSYREALDTFTRAGDALAGPDGAAAAKEEREKIIFDLGRFALAENESWIRAHRVRPIEPMH